MNTKIAFLRGINVGGKRKILMADLKLMCEKLGLESVKTYIQSGNIIFKSEKNNCDLENEIEKNIFDNFGFEVPVIVRTKKEIENSINKNPFFDKEADTKQLFLTFLKEKPNKEFVEKILTYSPVPDKFKIENNNVFLFCEGKYHDSKLTNNFFEKQLNVSATTRNWKTVLKLSELSKN